MGSVLTPAPSVHSAWFSLRGFHLYRTEFTEKETKVKIIADNAVYAKCAIDEIRTQRKIVEDYIRSHPEFRMALEPIDIPEDAPAVIQRMSAGSKLAGVGPMAAVAGVIAEFASLRMKSEGSSVSVVENGGDIYASSVDPVRIALFAGSKHSLNGLCIVVDKDTGPVSVCSSSSTMGHSMSFGNCDLVTVVAQDSSIADSFATAICNKVREVADLEKAVGWGNSSPHVRTVIAAKGEKVAMAGETAMLKTHDAWKIEDKITVHDGHVWE